jgi:hypothetical protein
MDPPEDGGPQNFAGIKKGQKKHQDGGQENGVQGDEQTLTFNNQQDDMENDLFAQRMLE